MFLGAYSALWTKFITPIYLRMYQTYYIHPNLVNFLDRSTTVQNWWFQIYFRKIIIAKKKSKKTITSCILIVPSKISPIPLLLVFWCTSYILARSASQCRVHARRGHQRCGVTTHSNPAFIKILHQVMWIRNGDTPILNVSKEFRTRTKGDFKVNLYL